MPVVNLEKIPSLPKPEGLKAAPKTPPKASAAPPASSPTEPPGRPSSTPPPPPKEPPGAGGDPPPPTASPVLKAGGEKEPGVCRPPPRAHKKLTRECWGSAGWGGGVDLGEVMGWVTASLRAQRWAVMPMAQLGGGEPHCGVGGGAVVHRGLQSLRVCGWIPYMGGCSPWGDEVLEGLQSMGSCPGSIQRWCECCCGAGGGHSFAPPPTSHCLVCPQGRSAT